MSLLDIQLKDEKEISSWQIDAWDPCVIDTAHKSYCKYKNFTIDKEFYTDEIEIKDYVFNFKKPIEGAPSDCPTPTEEIPIKS